MVQATANPDHSLDELESELLSQLDDIRSGNVSERELERAKNRVQASHVFQLERSGGFGGRADQLNYYNTYTGDPAFINKDLDRYMAVTAEDVRQAAAALGEARVKLSIHPEAERSASTTTIQRETMPAAARAARLHRPRSQQSAARQRPQHPARRATRHPHRSLRTRHTLRLSRRYSPGQGRNSPPHHHHAARRNRHPRLRPYLRRNGVPGQPDSRRRPAESAF